jgi:hypothetical protein
LASGTVALRDLIAFSHIEKAAGTTLIHILRRVFLMRFAAVRPLRAGPTSVLDTADMRTYLRINPFLKAIAGHALVAWSDAAVPGCQLHYITQIREPVARTLSQFNFWRNRMGKKVSIEEFLDHRSASNFQVRKIAGSDDLEQAKTAIRKTFLLAGAVDQFDEFLVLLSQKLGIPFSRFVYENKNQALGSSKASVSDKYLDQLRNQNDLDTELYQWVKTELLDTYIAKYSGDFASDLASFRQINARRSAPRLPVWCDSAYRNLYIKPASGLIRVRNGLPYTGSYRY